MTSQTLIDELIKKCEHSFELSDNIDVIKIAESLGLRVMSVDFKNDGSANIVYNNDSEQFIIYVNSKQKKERQRFSIAHEIAHYLLHKNEIKEKGKVDRIGYDSLSNEQEREADKLAAQILIPENTIKKKLSELRHQENEIIKSNTVIELASYFKVSIAVIAIKLRELGYHVPYVID